MADFAAWFAAWPWKVNRARAKAAWNALAGRGALPAIGAMLAATAAYVRSNPPGRQHRQWLNPLTWLGDERWRDWLGEGVAAPGAALPVTLPAELHRAADVALGVDRAASLLSGARLEGRVVTPKTRTAWERLKAEPGFCALLAAEGLALEPPPPRRPEGGP